MVSRAAEPIQIPTDDGLSLSGRLYRPSAESRGTAIILPCVGATQARYVDFASFLRDDGWTVLTFDYRGVGVSERAAAPADNAMARWGTHDFDGVISWAREYVRPTRLVAVGHSIGGQLIPMAAGASHLDAAVCVAAQRGHWRHWPGLYRLMMLVLWNVYVPVVASLLGRLPLPYGRQSLLASAAREWAVWGRNDDYRTAAGPLRARFAALDIPMLFLSFSDDTLYAPKLAVDALVHNYFVSARRLHCHVVPAELGLTAIGHSGFFSSAQCPRAWWNDVSAWLASVKRHDYPPCSLLLPRPSRLRITECV